MTGILRLLCSGKDTNLELALLQEVPKQHPYVLLLLRNIHLLLYVNIMLLGLFEQ